MCLSIAVNLVIRLLVNIRKQRDRMGLQFDPMGNGAEATYSVHAIGSEIPRFYNGNAGTTLFE